MKIIEQSVQWEQEPPSNAMQIIERIGRVCYKSEDRITSDSAEKFVRMILKSGHESVIEHIWASMRFITDRGVLAEESRHRLQSMSAESTRYVDYAKEFQGLPGHIEFIQPVDFKLTSDDLALLEDIEHHYRKRREQGLTPQQARYFLPNGLKTEIIVSANLRNWRHIFKLRTSKAAHPQMRALMTQALLMFKQKLPVLFEDL